MLYPEPNWLGLNLNIVFPVILGKRLNIEKNRYSSLIALPKFLIFIVLIALKYPIVGIGALI